MSSTTNELTNGDSVEVLKTWAYGMPPRWFGGYCFVRMCDNGRTAVLKHTQGTMNGSEVRYPTDMVRKVC